MTGRLRLALRAMLGASLFGACHHVQYYTPTDMTGVRFTAYSQLTGAQRDSVLIHISAVNESGKPRQFELGDCGIRTRVRLFHLDNIRQPAWELEKWSTGEGPTVFSGFRPPEACLLSLLVAMVPPGASIDVDQITLPVRIMLGDSLKPGKYHFEARSGVGGRPVDFVGAGNLVLGNPSALKTRIERSGSSTTSSTLSVAVVDSVSGESIPYARFDFQTSGADTSEAANRHSLNLSFKGSIDLSIPSGANGFVIHTNGYLPSVVMLAKGQNTRIFVPLRRDPAYRRPMPPWMAREKDSSRAK